MRLGGQWRDQGWDTKAGVPEEVLERGACRGADTDLFFPDAGNPESSAAGKAICATCPVVGPCGVYALGEVSLRGLWGGMSENERKRRRRDRRRRAA